MAYSTLQPELQHFVLDGIGYLACAGLRPSLLPHRAHRLVIGDPVCAPQDAARLLDAFLAEPVPTSFVHVSLETARLLKARGHAVGNMGMETCFSIRPLDFSGGRRARLRQWLHKARREGVEVREVCRSEIDTREMFEVSRQWLARKGGRGLGLLTRPLAATDEPGVRCFFAIQRGRMIGFVTFDPMFDAGRVVGYYTHHIRLLANAPHGTSAHIIVSAAQAFAAEGAELISLGISPLSPDPAPQIPQNRLYGVAARAIFRYGNFLYPFRGNDSHKRKYGGFRRPAYVCYRGLTIVELWRMVRAVNLF
jgi:lysylphosphatidylglycerol synthetase-like protein (DUF2156 family)